jgi:hypothetical protein
MRPSSLELLEILDEAFTTRIVPALEDPYVKARATVMSQIIGHLYQRFTLEGSVLWQDNAELADLLREVVPVAGAVDVPAALTAAEAVLKPGEYPSVALLDERNTLLKACLVEVLEQLDQPVPGRPPEAVAYADGLITAYLRRQLDRERDLCTIPALGASATRDLPLV